MSSSGSTTAARPASSSPTRKEAQPRSSCAICRKITRGNISAAWGTRHTVVVARAATISVTVTEIFDTTPQPCAVCGERPGTVRMVFAAGPQRRAAVLCKTCAEELKSRQPKTEPARPLGEFGSDLTAEAAAGRIDPVIGRNDEIAET